MAYAAQVLEVFIASPGDIVAERQIVREIVTEWNVIHSRDRHAVMMPVGWDTHSSPELGGRPQQMINDRLLEHADILVGMFWTRVGTATGRSASGTIEEIERHHQAGKPVMLYFSNMPVVPGSYDVEQFAKLQEFKAWARDQGLVESFDTPDDFREKLRRHLQQALAGNRYLQDLLAPDLTAIFERELGQTGGAPSLSADAAELLAAIASDRHGNLLVARHLGGIVIQAGDRNFVQDDSRWTEARWEAAVDELAGRRLIVDRSAKGEVYEMTAAGYEAAEPGA